jgi:cobalt-zinc-cadmium efflux system membrane fusion protein
VKNPLSSLSLLTLLTLALSAALPACTKTQSEPLALAEPVLTGRQLQFPAAHPQLKLLKLTAAAPGQSADLALTAKLVWNEALTQRIYAPFAGRVERIDADLGQTLKAGAVLAQMASPDFGQAQADAARAQADQSQAAKQLLRQRELLAAGIVARRDFEQAEADAARTEAELARAQGRVRLYGGAGSNLGGPVNQLLSLRTRLPGVVVERNLNPGQELRPDQSGPGVPPLFVISDPSSLWVQIDARESEVATLQPGAVFALELPAWPGRRFEGRITALADAIDPSTRTIKVRGVIANPERLLKSEMLATAHVQRSLGAGVVVPTSAVILEGEKKWLYVSPKPGVFEPREIKLSMMGSHQSVVAQGLEAGELVVSENALLLARQFHMTLDEAKPETASTAPPKPAPATVITAISTKPSTAEGEQP